MPARRNAMDSGHAMCWNAMSRASRGLHQNDVRLGLPCGHDPRGEMGWLAGKVSWQEGRDDVHYQTDRRYTGARQRVWGWRPLNRRSNPHQPDAGQVFIVTAGSSACPWRGPWRVASKCHSDGGDGIRRGARGEMHLCFDADARCLFGSRLREAGGRMHICQMGVYSRKKDVVSASSDNVCLGHR